MTKFTAIVTAHASSAGCYHMLGVLLYQTRQPDEVHLIASTITHGELVRLREEFEPRFPVFKIHAVENENDWGHAKRAQGIELASGDYLGFFNADDDYEPRYLEKMLLVAESTAADAVYCDWSGTVGTTFTLRSSTSGNFIVRREIAIEAGYEERCYEADGMFIERVNALPTVVVKVPEVLYYHNRGPQQ